MLLDLTHLTDEAFWEAVAIYDGLVLASHNNCRALVPHQRQFSDEQLKLLIERDGVVGAAFDIWMLQPGFLRGGSNEAVLIDHVVDHIDHVCQLAGNSRHAAIGTDLDGGFGREQSPCDLDTIVDSAAAAGQTDRPRIQAGGRQEYYVRQLAAPALRGLGLVKCRPGPLQKLTANSSRASLTLSCRIAFFDAHAHLFCHQHFADLPEGYRDMPPCLNLASYHHFMDWIHPKGCTVGGLFFGLAFSGDRDQNNEFVAEEVSNSPGR